MEKEEAGTPHQEQDIIEDNPIDTNEIKNLDETTANKEIVDKTKDDNKMENLDKTAADKELDDRYIKAAQWICNSDYDPLALLKEKEIILIFVQELSRKSPDSLFEEYERFGITEEEGQEGMPCTAVFVRKGSRLTVDKTYLRQWHCGVTFVDSLTGSKFHVVHFRMVGPPEKLNLQFQDIVDHVVVVRFREPALSILMVGSCGGITPRDLGRRYRKMETLMMATLKNLLDLRSINLPGMPKERDPHSANDGQTILIPGTSEGDVVVPGNYLEKGTLLSFALLPPPLKSNAEEFTIKDGAELKSAFRRAGHHVVSLFPSKSPISDDAVTDLIITSYTKYKDAWRDYKPNKEPIVLQEKDVVLPRMVTPGQDSPSYLNLVAWNCDGEPAEQMLLDNKIHVACVASKTFQEDFNSEIYEQLVSIDDGIFTADTRAAIFIDKNRCQIKNKYKICESAVGVTVYDNVLEHTVHIISFTFDCDVIKAQRVFNVVFSHIIDIKVEHTDLGVMMMGTLPGTYTDGIPATATSRPGFYRRQNLAEARGSMRKMYCVFESYLGLKTIYFRPIDGDNKTAIMLAGVDPFTSKWTPGQLQLERKFVPSSMFLTLPRNASKLRGSLRNRLKADFKRTLRQASRDRAITEVIRPLCDNLMYKIRWKVENRADWDNYDDEGGPPRNAKDVQRYDINSDDGWKKPRHQWNARQYFPIQRQKHSYSDRFEEDYQEPHFPNQRYPNKKWRRSDYQNDSEQWASNYDGMSSRPANFRRYPDGPPFPPHMGYPSNTPFQRPNVPFQGQNWNRPGGFQQQVHENSQIPPPGTDEWVKRDYQQPVAPKPEPKATKGPLYSQPPPPPPPKVGSQANRAGVSSQQNFGQSMYTQQTGANASSAAKSVARPNTNSNFYSNPNAGTDMQPQQGQVSNQEAFLQANQSQNWQQWQQQWQYWNQWCSMGNQNVAGPQQKP